MRAAAVVQQLCKSCRTCFMFYCICFILLVIAPLQLARVKILQQWLGKLIIVDPGDIIPARTRFQTTGSTRVCWRLVINIHDV